MDRFLNWPAKNGWVLLAFALGLLLGILIWQPAGWKLPDPVLTLLGSIIGAAGAVGGAFLLWQAQEKKHARSIVVRIDQHLLVLSAALGSFIKDVRDPIKPLNDQSVTTIFADELEALTSRIRPYADELHVLPEKQAAAFIGIELALDDLPKIVKRVRSSAAHGFLNPLLDTKAKCLSDLEAALEGFEEMRKSFR